MQTIKFYTSLVFMISCLASCNRHEAPNPATPEPSSAQPQTTPESGRFASPQMPTTPVQTQPDRENRKQPTLLPQDTQAELDVRIKQTFAANCRFERACDQLIGIDCDSAVDGPYYYAEPDTLNVVARCGGFCMSGSCENCPPSAWTCTTY